MYEPISEDWNTITENILPMTVNQFYDTFLSDNASFGLDHLGIKLGRFDMNLEKWRMKDGIQQRTLTCIVPVKGVPFVSQTRNERNMTLIKEDNRLQFDCINKNPDLPYADSFLVREKWIVLSKDAMTQKCLMRVTLNIEFIKSTLFKGKIMGRGTEAIKETHEFWKKYVSELGYFNKKEIKVQQP